MMSTVPTNAFYLATGTPTPWNMSIEHWRHRQRVVAVMSSATINVPDGEDTCQVFDITTNAMLAAVPTMTSTVAGSPTGSLVIGGTATVATTGATDTVEFGCH